MEKLAKLKTAYGTRAITAGNAPGFNDGATAILFMTREKAAQLRLTPLATIVGMVSIAISPERLAECPGYAIQKVLEFSDEKLDNIDIIEINEAFAAVPLVSLRILADNDKENLKKLKEKTNVNGSAIAIGHPNTSSGARIIMNLCYELRRRGGGLAVGSICGGLAQADACILKV